MRNQDSPASPASLWPAPALGSVVVTGLKQVDAIGRDEVNDTVLLGEAAGPCVRREIAKGLGLTDSREGIPKNGLHEIHAAEGELSIGIDPMPKIVPKLRVKNRLSLSPLVSLADQARPSPEAPPIGAVLPCEHAPAEAP